MDIKELKEYVEKNGHLVTVNEMSVLGHPDTIVKVLKYKRRVFYDNLWDEYLEECRGLVVDKDWNIVSYPFTKIYNYGVEERSPTFKDDEIVFASRKVNGFMAAVSQYNGKIIVNTTGSANSQYVVFVWEFLDKPEILAKMQENLSLYPNDTFLFECVHPDDPHIISEVPGLYYLGQREKRLGSPIKFLSAWWFNEFVPHHGFVKFSNVKEYAKTCKHEGYVISSLDDKRAIAKIKSPYYLVNKLFARAGNIDSLLNGRAKLIVEEEFFPLVDYLKENRELFISMGEQERLSFTKSFFERTIYK